MPRGIKNPDIPKLTAEEVREIFHYDPATGVLLWRKRHNGVRPDRVAGCAHQQGYIAVHVRGAGYLAHRLAWAYVTGQWPECEIDHIDLDKSNNRWVNLREAEPYQNCANRKVRSDSGTGIKGVQFRDSKKKWRATLCVKGKKRHLGHFDTAEEAHAAYVIAASRAHNEFART